ncbi:MAG TPA: peptidylprolyl isomerase [Gaiellaceae bacterium]|nr:peptidylprolyl isomerase [Gaiellaceae bacterium]
MKKRFLLLFVPLALVAVLAAGCGGGGGSGSVPADSIAKVGSTPITKSTFNALLTVAFARFKAQGQAAPKVGTPAYTQLRDQAVSFLVQEEELQQEGTKLGVTVSQKDIDDRLAQIRQTYYHGSETKLEAALKKDDITLAELEQYNLRPALLSEKLEAKVTSDVKVSNADAQKYYTQNKASFTTPQTREVRHILVNSKSLAQQIETKLKNGESFASLAKKYSKDTGSAQQGGKLCVAHGGSSGACQQTVPPFDKAAFSLKTNKVSQPVHSQFGWHVIQALSPVKPAHTQTFKEAESQIQASLAQQKKQTAWTAWLTKLKNDFKGKVAFQTGYAPVTTTTPTTPAPTTTG